MTITRFVRGLKPADVNVAAQTLTQINKVFSADPALSPTPAGLLVIPTAAIGYGPGSGMSAYSFPYRHDLVPSHITFTLLHPKQYCPKGTNCRLDRGEGPSLGVSVNTPAVAMYRQRPYIDKEGNPDKWYLAPRQIGEIAGFPLYENGKVVITKSQRPLWFPVTREEWVRARIADEHSDTWRQKLEQELSSLANPSGPAYCCPHKAKHPASGLAEANEEATQMVVRLNKDFFDPALGAGTAQVITVDTAITIDQTLGKGHRDRPLIEDIVNKLDWQSLAALVR